VAKLFSDMFRFPLRTAREEDLDEMMSGFLSLPDFVDFECEISNLIFGLILSGLAGEAFSDCIRAEETGLPGVTLHIGFGEQDLQQGNGMITCNRSAELPSDGSSSP
jgi:hypothetical protein